LKNLGTSGKTATNVNFTTDSVTGGLGKTDATRFGKYLNSAIALTYVAPGAPMLNAGQEIAYSKALKPFDKDSIVWPSKAPATTAFITKLSKLRQTNSVLLTAPATTITTASKSVLAFKRSSSAGSVFYLANLSAKAVTTKVTFGAKLSVYDFTSGKKITLATSQNVSVPANGFLIYSTKKVS
jgi:glycosidase